jgi:hypothetical protein
MNQDKFNLKQLTFFFIILLVITLPCHAKEYSQLQQLLSPFSGTPHIKLAYQEKRFSLFFKTPRLYQGTIEYISPDTFIKSVQLPDRKKFVLKKNTLSIYDYSTQAEDGTEKVHEVSLDDYPQFKQLKALFLGLFQGDASLLLEYYQYKIYVLENNKTRLVLKSLVSDQFIQDKLASQSKQQIDIIFHQQQIIKIIMASPGNERSELVFKTPPESSLK